MNEVLETQHYVNNDKTNYWSIHALFLHQSDTTI